MQSHYPNRCQFAHHTTDTLKRTLIGSLFFLPYTPLLRPRELLLVEYSTMKQLMYDGNPVFFEGKPVMEFLHNGKLVQGVVKDESPLVEKSVTLSSRTLITGDIIGTLRMPRMSVDFMYLGPPR